MFQASANREPKPLLRRQTRFLNEVRVAKKAPEAMWLPQTECHGRQKIQEGLPGAGGKPVAPAWRRGRGGLCGSSLCSWVVSAQWLPILKFPKGVLWLLQPWVCPSLPGGRTVEIALKKNGFQRKNLQILTPSRVP